MQCIFVTQNNNRHLPCVLFFDLLLCTLVHSGHERHVHDQCDMEFLIGKLRQDSFHERKCKQAWWRLSYDKDIPCLIGANAFS